MYAICRTLKMKNANDILASDKHCRRVAGRGTESSHIDPSLSQYNISYHTYTNEDGTAKPLNEAFDLLVEHQGIKIPRKDSVKIVEMMFTLSPEAFEGVNRSKGLKNASINDFAQGATDFLNRLGVYILDYHVHLDETTPHMHAHVVITDKNKKNEEILCASALLDGRKKLTEFQDRYYASMVARIPGLKRGLPSEVTQDTHMTLKEIKQALVDAGIDNTQINQISKELLRQKNPEQVVEAVLEAPEKQQQRTDDLQRNPQPKNDKGFPKDLSM
jgi:hypothetical protein